MSEPRKKIVPKKYEGLVMILAVFAGIALSFVASLSLGIISIKAPWTQDPIAIVTPEDPEGHGVQEDSHEGHDHAPLNPEEGLFGVPVLPEHYGPQMDDITFAQWKELEEPPNAYNLLFPPNQIGVDGFAGVYEVYGTPIEDGTEVTVSFKAKSVREGTADLTVAEKGFADIMIKPKTIEVGTEWEENVITFQANVVPVEGDIEYSAKSYFVSFASQNLNDLSISDLAVYYSDAADHLEEEHLEEDAHGH